MSETLPTKQYVDFDGNPIEPGSLADRVMGEAAEGWRPSAGDVLTGVVIDIDDGTSEFGDYPLLTVRTPNGQEVAVHCFHTVLGNRIERLITKGRLVEGSEIAIRYQGQEESKKKGMDGPHMYRVAVNTPTP